MSTLPVSPRQEEILRALLEKVDAVETELKSLGWWMAQPPDLQAEVAAGAAAVLS